MSNQPRDRHGRFAETSKPAVSAATTANANSNDERPGAAVERDDIPTRSTKYGPSIRERIVNVGDCLLLNPDYGPITVESVEYTASTIDIVDRRRLSWLVERFIDTASEKLANPDAEQADATSR